MCNCAANANFGSEILSFPESSVTDLLVAAKAELDFEEDLLQSSLQVSTRGSLYATAASYNSTEGLGQISLLGSTRNLPGGIKVNATMPGADQVKITLTMKSPVEVEHTYTFNINGDSIALVPEELPRSAVEGLPNPLCILQCGGSSILGLLVGCLPTFLTGGPSAFIPCVVGQAGPEIANIVECVVSKCL